MADGMVKWLMVKGPWSMTEEKPFWSVLSMSKGLCLT